MTACLAQRAWRGTAPDASDLSRQTAARAVRGERAHSGSGRGKTAHIVFGPAGADARATHPIACVRLARPRKTDR